MLGGEFLAFLVILTTGGQLGDNVNLEECPAVARMFFLGCFALDLKIAGAILVELFACTQPRALLSGASIGNDVMPYPILLATGEFEASYIRWLRRRGE